MKITYFIEFFLHNLINLKTEESKCVVNLSQSINNIKGVGQSKIIHDRNFYTCSYLFFNTMEPIHFVELFANLYI